jgi:hypothetical protein
VSAQLGHKRNDLTITEIYAPHDPDYLKDAVRVSDFFFDQLRVSCVVLDQLLDGNISAK